MLAWVSCLGKFLEEEVELMVKGRVCHEIYIHHVGINGCIYRVWKVIS